MDKSVVYTVYMVLLAILACWRLAHMLHVEDGPGGVFIRTRSNNSFIDKLFSCFDCLSVWVAFPFALALAGSLWEVVVYMLALSAGAIILNRIAEIL